MLVDGEASEEVEVTSGVSQGSVMWPTYIFFLIDINDMVEYTKHYSITLFADNTIIYLTRSAENNCEKLQEDFQAYAKWEKAD